MVIIAGFIAASISQTGGAPGLTAEGDLSPCPSSPNCVVSLPGTGDRHAIAPISLPEIRDPDLLAAAIKEVMSALQAKLVKEDGRYLAFTVESPFFGFVDDIEFLMGDTALQIRSASRVGYGDGDANRMRVEEIRKRLLSHE